LVFEQKSKKIEKKGAHPGHTAHVAGRNRQFGASVFCFGDRAVWRASRPR